MLNENKNTIKKTNLPSPHKHGDYWKSETEVSTEDGRFSYGNSIAFRGIELPRVEIMVSNQDMHISRNTLAESPMITMC